MLQYKLVRDPPSADAKSSASQGPLSLSKMQPERPGRVGVSPTRLLALADRIQSRRPGRNRSFVPSFYVYVFSTPGLRVGWLAWSEPKVVQIVCAAKALVKKLGQKLVSTGSEVNPVEHEQLSAHPLMR